MKTEKTLPSYLEFASLIAIRSTVFPIEHVLERIKLEAQKNSETSIKELWKEKRLRGLFEGSAAGITRLLVKETYQLSFALLINNFWQKHIPKKHNKDNLTTNLLTGLSIATFIQAGLTLPIDRVLIEKVAKNGYAPFFKSLQNEKPLKIFSSLYEGYQVTLLRHSFVWTTFFLSNHAAGNLIKKADQKNQHPNISWLTRGLFTSTTIVGAAYPLELLRNRILIEPAILSKGTIHAIKTLYKRYGFYHLYRGAPIFWFHNCIQTLFIQTFFDKMNKKF